MRVRLSVLGVAIFLGAVASAAQGQKPDGNALLARCDRLLAVQREGQAIPKSADSLEMGVCVGFVNGVWSTNEVAGLLLGKYLFCPPDEMPADKQIETLVRYLKAHRSDLQKHETVLAVRAFQAAWPCKAKP